MCAKLLSHIPLFVTPWTVVHQAPLSMEFSRQECWSGLACLPPGDLPNLGIEPASLMSPELAGRFFTTSATLGAPVMANTDIIINAYYVLLCGKNSYHNRILFYDLSMDSFLFQILIDEEMACNRLHSLSKISKLSSHMILLY